jgi:hypothetical protein
MGRACSTHGRKEVHVSYGKYEGRRPLGRPRCRREGDMSIKAGLREIGCEGVKWINLAQNRG